MSKIFYVDPDFEKGIHDRTLFKFERMYQGFGVPFLIVGFIIGLLILFFCWRVFTNLSFYQQIYSGWQESQAKVISCEASSLAEAGMSDYLHMLTYEFTAPESQNQQHLKQASSPLFLKQDRCGEMLAAESITIQYDPTQTDRSIVVDDKFSPSFTDEVDRLARADNSKLYLALAQLGLLGIFGVVYPVKYLLARRNWQKMVENGEFLKGEIVEIDRKTFKVKSEEIPYYQVRYAFTSPANKNIEGTFDLDVERIEVENSPQIGTRLLILYVNERCYSPV